MEGNLIKIREDENLNEAKILWPLIELGTC